MKKTIKDDATERIEIENKNGVEWISTYKKVPWSTDKTYFYPGTYYIYHYRCTRCGAEWTAGSSRYLPGQAACINNCTNRHIFLQLLDMLRGREPSGFGQVFKVEFFTKIIK